MREPIKDIQDLIIEYRETLIEIEKLKEERKGANKKERRIISGIIGDLNEALQWMETGKDPELRRPIERRAAYQRHKVLDTLLMQRYFRSTETIYSWDTEIKENVISTWDRIKLEDAMSTLSAREKEIYMMYKGYCLSMEEIAKKLKLAKSTVQTNLERAEDKILKQINGSLFCMTE